MTQSGAIDGCGADFSAGGTNSLARNTVEYVMAWLQLDEATATAWLAGQRQMMEETTAALGDGILIA